VFTYDPSSDLGKVRLLITDRDAQVATFSDEEISAIYDLCGQSVRMTAAQLLDTLAANEALVQKRIKTLSLETDGAVVAKALHDLAATLREQENLQDGGFDVAEMVNTDFGRRERWLKQIQKG
jgi:hypothetical protein